MVWTCEFCSSTVSGQPSSNEGWKPPVSEISSAVTWAPGMRSAVAGVVREGADANFVTSSNQVIADRHGATATGGTAQGNLHARQPRSGHHTDAPSGVCDDVDL